MKTKSLSPFRLKLATARRIKGRRIGLKALLARLPKGWFRIQRRGNTFTAIPAAAGVTGYLVVRMGDEVTWELAALAGVVADAI